MAATSGQRPARARPPRQDVSLLRWVWRAYIRHALVPLLLVELLLVAVYLASHAWSLRKNVTALADVARLELARTADDEAAVLERQLGQVAGLTEVLRRQAAAALTAPVPRARDRARLRRQPSGALTTWHDDGGAAVFWSALTAPGPADFDRLERLATLDPLLRDVTLANPLIAQAYINTRDSLTRIWPWVDAAAVFDPAVSTPDFSFYYEADADHNPARAVVWTDAYVDPAGRGWLVSAIAPVYRRDFLEAVVGADVTIDHIIGDVLAQDVPWDGFLLLIGKSGTLLALPPQGEELFGLKELTAHRYVDAIRADTFKPEAFNVYRSRDLARIGKLLRSESSGSGRLAGPEPYLVAWQTIPSVGWKLMSLVPEQAVFAPSRALNRDLATIGWVLVAGLAGFYAFYLAVLYRRARYVSRSIAEPLAQIERMARRIAVGQFEQAPPEFHVGEFRHTVGELSRLGRLLGDADRAKSRFVATAAHELRTPIAVITGYAEYLQASDPPPAQRREILATMRRQGDQIAGIVTELLDLARIEARAGRDFTMLRQPLEPLARRVVESLRVGEYARVPSPEGDADGAEVFVDAGKFGQALTNVIANACKYSPPGTPVTVRLLAGAAEAGVAVADRGGGMDDETQRRIFEAFYRAESTAGVAGTGLGMSIAKEIMDIHGGRIDVESAPGEGTVVTLWLPRAAPRG